LEEIREPEDVQEGVPLSPGETNRLQWEDFQKRRTERLVQVRQQEKMLAMARRQKYEEEVARKREAKIRKKQDTWERKRRLELERCKDEYKKALAKLGAAHHFALMAGFAKEAAIVKKQEIYARNRLRIVERHEAALHKADRVKKTSLFFVRQSNAERRKDVRNALQDESRGQARRAAEKRRRVEILEEKRLAEGNEERSKMLETESLVFEESFNVPQVTPGLHDFSKTRFHAEFTQHSKKSSGFDAGQKLNEAREARHAHHEKETERQVFEASNRGKQAMTRIAMEKDREALEEDLKELQNLELASGRRNLEDRIKKIRQSRTIRDELDQKKKMLENFTETFVQPVSESIVQPEIVQVIPEEEEPAPQPEKGEEEGVPPEKIVDQGLTLPFRDFIEESEDDADIVVPAAKVAATPPSASFPRVPQESIAKETSPMSASTIVKEEAVTDERKDEFDESQILDAETRELLEQSRLVRKKANEKVQEILRLGHAFLEGPDSSAGLHEHESASSRELALQADAAIATSAAARASAAQTAEQRQKRYLPSLEHLEETISRYLEEGEESQEEEEVTRPAREPHEEERKKNLESAYIKGLALSMLHDLEKRDSLASVVSSARSDVSSLRFHPLTPRTLDETASTEPEDVENLLVDDEGWKNSAAFTEWLLRIENALYREEEGVEEDFFAESFQRSQDIVEGELVVEDDAWKNDGNVAELAGSLADFFNKSVESPASQKEYAMTTPGLEARFQALDKGLKSAVRRAEAVSVPKQGETRQLDFSVENDEDVGFRDDSRSFLLAEDTSAAISIRENPHGESEELVSDHREHRAFSSAKSVSQVQAIRQDEFEGPDSSKIIAQSQRLQSISDRSGYEGFLLESTQQQRDHCNEGSPIADASELSAPSSSFKSLDSLEKVKEALRAAREELRAVAKLQEMPSTAFDFEDTRTSSELLDEEAQTSQSVTMEFDFRRETVSREHREAQSQNFVEMSKARAENARRQSLRASVSSEDSLQKKSPHRSSSGHHQDLVTRLSSGLRADLTPREQRDLSRRSFSRLPEVQLRQEAERTRKEAEERRQRAREFDEKRRKNLFRKGN